MDKNTLLIFIDGFQYDESKRLRALQNADVTGVKPSIGFSNNIYPEMFCGTTPDQIGYFNEWHPNNDRSTFKKFSRLKILDFLRKYKYINAVLRLILLKKIFKRFIGNIPFSYADYFTASGSHDFFI